MWKLETSMDEVNTKVKAVMWMYFPNQCYCNQSVNITGMHENWNTTVTHLDNLFTLSVYRLQPLHNVSIVFLVCLQTFWKFCGENFNPWCTEGKPGILKFILKFLPAIINILHKTSKKMQDVLCKATLALKNVKARQN